MAQNEKFDKCLSQLQLSGEKLEAYRNQSRDSYNEISSLAVGSLSQSVIELKSNIEISYNNLVAEESNLEECIKSLNETLEEYNTLDDSDVKSKNKSINKADNIRKDLRKVDAAYKKAFDLFSRLCKDLKKTISNVKKVGDKPVKIGNLDTNKQLLPLNVYGFISCLKAFLNKNCNNGDYLGFQAFVDCNNEGSTGSAYKTFCRKSGLCNDNFVLTELAKALSDNAISFQEYLLILISKQWINFDGHQINLLQTFYKLFKDAEIDLNLDFREINKSLDINKDKESDNIIQVFEDAFSAQVGSKIAEYINVNPVDVTNRLGFIKSALVLSKLCIEIDGRLKVNPVTIPVWEEFESIQLEAPYIDCSSDEYYEYIGDMHHGIFEVSNMDVLHNCYPNLLNNKQMNSLQQIYYGAPGTGKSNEITLLTGEGKDGVKFDNDCTFRITFHPDSDYSSFVGAYKPTTKEDEEGKSKIVYDFRPQAFIKAYIKAWLKPEKPVALVIEEINRGNCAQIFGDIFQLLDRFDDCDLSKYPIEADIDVQSYLARAFQGTLKEFNHEVLPDTMRALVNEKYKEHYADAFEKIKNGEILALPSNLSILATMNTSDQSLFPMDSAFKRRWDWIYQPIVEGTKKNSTEPLGWKIKVDDKHELVDWWTFIERINEIIADLTTSEDKQLGYFFCQPDKKAKDGDPENSIISAERFVGKVIFYLWNDVFKDYAFEADCCKLITDEKGGKKEALFAKFYKSSKIIDTGLLVRFFESLKKEDEDPLIKNIETITQSPGDNDGDESPSSVTEEVAEENNAETQQ